MFKFIFRPAIAALLLTCSSQVSAGIDPSSDEYIKSFGPFQSWKTEPTLESSLIEVIKGDNDPSSVYPGHIIFSTSTFKLGGHSWGPQIFDSDLNLVYMSSKEHQIASQDPHVCDFAGSIGTHLCAGAVGALTRGRGQSVKLVYNSSYVDVGQAYGAVGGLRHPDGHEYNMLDGGESLLQIVYEPRKMNLEEFHGPKEGYALDACLQEVSVDNDDLLFQWCFLDHYPVWETYIFPVGNTVNLTSPIAGKGTKDSMWDLIHANGADKNREGDYLLSARHLDQLIKIAGNNNTHGVQPGTVLWRLGGKHSDFAMNDAIFARQHHARFVETGESETLISLFDNSWEGHNSPAHNASAGRIIKVNNSTMQASLVREYIHPEDELSMAQGSMHILPNKNVLVGWGWNPEISEFTEDGSLIYHARLGNIDEKFVYRAYKTQWVGKPLWSPKIVAYSQTCRDDTASPLVAYVSWNGATEVKSYRFYVKPHHKVVPWLPAGTFPKQGFETQVTLMGGFFTKRLTVAKQVYVEALDSRGIVLGSATTKTFIPFDWAAKQCNETECFAPPRFDYDLKFSSIDKCKSSLQPSFFMLAVVVILIEGCVYMYYRLVILRTRRTRVLPPTLDAETVPLHFPQKHLM